MNGRKLLMPMTFARRKVDVRGDGPGAVFLQVFILHGFKSHILVTAHSA